MKGRYPPPGSPLWDTPEWMAWRAARVKPAPRQGAPMFDDSFDWWMVVAVFAAGAVVGAMLCYLLGKVTP